MICKNCNKKTPNPKFCSSSCSASYNNKKRKHSTITKIKISSGVRKNIPASNIDYDNCPTCGNLYVKHKRRKKYCGISCAKKRIRSQAEKDSASIRMKKRFEDNPELHPNRLCAGIKESYPEKMFREYLVELGLVFDRDFVSQYKIGKYFVDFYIPSINLSIEIDGEHWHDKKSRRELTREQFIVRNTSLIRFDAKRLINKEYEREIQDMVAQVVERQSSKLQAAGSMPVHVS